MICQFGHLLASTPSSLLTSARGSLTSILSMLSFLVKLKLLRDPALRQIFNDVPGQQQVSSDAVGVGTACSKATQGRNPSDKARKNMEAVPMNLQTDTTGTELGKIVVVFERCAKGKPLPRIYTHRHFTLFYNNDQIIEAISPEAMIFVQLSGFFFFHCLPCFPVLISLQYGNMCCVIAAF